MYSWIFCPHLLCLWSIPGFKSTSNNYDSLTCHMTRIGFWLQNGNLQSWPTWVVTQRIYPFNAQFQILWSVLFWGSDQFAGFAQWIAALIAMLGIIGIARLAGWSRTQSLFASFIFSLFPEILLESTTTQNHLITASLLLCAFYFFLADSKTKPNPNLYFQVSPLAWHWVPINLLSLYYLASGHCSSFVVEERKNNLEICAVLFIDQHCGFWMLGSIKYVMNISAYGSPFYDLTAMQTWVNNSENYWTPKNGP